MENELFQDLIVVKRSGQRVNFNSLKIAIAVKRAFDSVNKNYTEKEINKVYEDILQYIIDNYKERKTINVEDIQDIIEKILKQDKYYDVYESFSNYRIRRSESRKAFSIKRQHKFVKVIEKIGSYNSKTDNFSPKDSLLDFGKTISNEYTKSYVIDGKFIKAFDEGRIYIHDFDYFNLGFLYNTHLKINSVLDQENCYFSLLELLINAKHEINGEIAIDNLDIVFRRNTINKYKRKFKENLIKYLDIMGYLEFINCKKLNDLIDKEESINSNLLNFKEIMVNKQIENIINKAYLDSYNYIKEDLEKFIKHMLITLNNVYGKNNKYSISLGLSDTNEGNLIKELVINSLNNLNYLENVTIVFKLKKDSSLNYKENIINLIIDNKNIKLVFPDTSFNKNSIIDYFSNGYRIYEDTSDFKTNGRMMVCNTSINLARLGLKYRTLNNSFYEELDEIIELTKNELLFVFESIGDKSLDNYKVIFRGNILEDEKLEIGQKIRKVIKNGTLNINIIGLKECANAINKDSKDKIILQVLKYLNDKINKISLETKLNFTLSSVNTSDASTFFIDLDKTIYGLINEVTNKDKYGDLSKVSLDNIDYIKEVSKYQKLLTGGNEIIINIPKKITNKKINEIIDILINSDVGFTGFRIGNEKV